QAFERVVEGPAQQQLFEIMLDAPMHVRHAQLIESIEFTFAHTMLVRLGLRELLVSCESVRQTRSTRKVCQNNLIGSGTPAQVHCIGLEVAGEFVRKDEVENIDLM